ncbi:UNVERIFIED_ORG: hypothetical protein LHJ69_12935 [Shinella sp. XGS7]|nr:hypothetical protein [Shinella sp. XGS7]
MPEPTSTATATLVAAASAVPPVTLLGISLGLRADLLIAGFAGSLVAIILLDTVPGLGDTWQHLVRTSMRRMAVACASSITAGYMTPLALLLAAVPESLLLSMAFLVGAGAQKLLVKLLAKYWGASVQDGERGGA